MEQEVCSGGQQQLWTVQGQKHRSAWRSVVEGPVYVFCASVNAGHMYTQLKVFVNPPPSDFSTTVHLQNCSSVVGLIFNYTLIFDNTNLNIPNVLDHRFVSFLEMNYFLNQSS